MSDFIVNSVDGMAAFGARLARAARAGDVVVLTGSLGAGKTTLARAFGEALGVRGPVTSPTFVIARTHPSLRGGPALIHADAYRLASALELDDLDLDFDEAVTLIEWGGEYVSAITDSWLEVIIDRPRAASDTDGSSREITLRAVGERWSSTELAALRA